MPWSLSTAWVLGLLAVAESRGSLPQFLSQLGGSGGAEQQSGNGAQQSCQGSSLHGMVHAHTLVLALESDLGGV